MNTTSPPGERTETPRPSLLERAKDMLVTLDEFVLREYARVTTSLPYFALFLIALSAILYCRHPASNYIFDEQEALLANPYVNGKGPFLEAIHKDFWGLPPDRSVGSYRPIPNFLWRLLWRLTEAPIAHQLYNVVLHGLTAFVLAMFIERTTRKRALSLLTGVLFVTAAVLTEAVSGVVGIADVLGGLGAALSLLALTTPAWVMPFLVFFSMLLALFSKESGVVCVPLIPFAALLTARLAHRERPQRILRSAVALLATLSAFILYVELRKQWFPSPLPSELEVEPGPSASAASAAFHKFLVWFHQAPLPKDPINNPLIDADKAHRIAGALRVYFRGLTQVFLPIRLSGDYSYPQEPIPEELFSFESVAGGVGLVLPVLVAAFLILVGLFRERTQSQKTAALVRRRSADKPLLFGGAVLSGFGATGITLYLTTFRHTDSLAKFVEGPIFLQVLPFVPLIFLGIGALIEGSPSYAVRKREVIPDKLFGPNLLALGLVWVVVSYFPHSNIPLLLPTVRAERFWYFPVLGTSIVLAILFFHLLERARSRIIWAQSLIFSFVLFQSAQAYSHAMDYRDDLAFWRATRYASPRSAKAHMNYSIMLGARGKLDRRLEESKVALKLAPKWPMAHVYTGDTLCRLGRYDEAWSYYRDGFALGPNEQGLIALGLQCLYDGSKLSEHDAELRALAEEHPGSWIAYLAVDTLDNGETHKGVDPQYRPRGYNQKAKD